MMAASSPMVQAPKLSPISQLRSIFFIGFFPLPHACENTAVIPAFYTVKVGQHTVPPTKAAIGPAFSTGEGSGNVCGERLQGLQQRRRQRFALPKELVRFIQADQSHLKALAG